MKKFYLPLCYLGVLSLALLGSLSMSGQNIKTVAGNGVRGYSGDGGAATAASMNEGWGVAIDRMGRLWFADGGNNRIRMVNDSGVVVTVAGNGTPAYGGDGGAATAAQLQYPSGISLDTAGNLFISDANNGVIRKVNTSGVITTIAGTGTAGFSGDGGPATSAQIVYSDGIATDSRGNIYIPDCMNHRIRKVDTAGIINTIVGTGYTGSSGDGGAATAAVITYPSDIAIDRWGNLIFTDYLESVVRKVDTAGIITTVVGTGTAGFGGDGGAATAAMLQQPVGVDVDRFGNLYIGDRSNNRVRKVNAAGIISTIAGIGSAAYSGDGGPATAAELYAPHKVAVDLNGNVYIADRYNYAIRKIQIPNRAPLFENDTVASYHVCAATWRGSIDSVLAISDSDYYQTETWSIHSNPHHGSLAGFPFSSPSRGAQILPSGLTYTPASGYNGHDTFAIVISDGINTQTKNVYVSVDSSICHTAVVEVSKNAQTVDLYPNPNNGTFSVMVASGQEVQFSIAVTNILGNVVLAASGKTNQTLNLNIPGRKGMYFVSISTPTGLTTRKMVVE